jgi:hypothetical protein
MRGDSHVVGSKAFVKSPETFDSQGFDEAVYNVFVQKSLASRIDA